MTPAEFRAIRKAICQQQAAAGDALGVSVDTISRVESGKMGDPIPPLYALAIQMLAQIKAAVAIEAQALDADAQAKRFRGGSDPWADRTARSRALHNSAAAILALRDKPAPGVTPKIEVKFTWAKGDEEFWVHLKSPDGKSAGFNLGNPKGMIATALLRAIAGGGDE